MTIVELYRALRCHDWFYAMSDDPGVYHRGNENWDRLQREMMAVDGGPELVREYSKHVFSGPAFGTPKHPKPTLPGSDSKVRGASESPPPLDADVAIQPNPALPGSMI